MKKIIMLVALAAAMAAKADYWMTFCKTPSGQQYAQVGYVKPDADGFVTIKAGSLTVVVMAIRCILEMDSPLSAEHREGIIQFAMNDSYMVANILREQGGEEGISLFGGGGQERDRTADTRIFSP